MTDNDRQAREHNKKAWNRMVADKRRFTNPARDKDLVDPLGTVDAAGWLGGDIAGQRVLCLGAGGGKQGPIYAAAGAAVTVVDISGAMLELDRQVAAERQIDMRIIETSMDDLSMFNLSEFDLVIHPVSTCYLPNIEPVYQQVARVLRDGGLYISQHKTPGSLQASQEASQNGYELTEPYYRTGPLPAVSGSLTREEGTLEFLHRWEQLVGGMCRAGFVIEDLTEPFHADPNADYSSFGHRSCFVAPYVRIKARRISRQVKISAPSQIVMP